MRSGNEENRKSQNERIVGVRTRESIEESLRSGSEEKIEGT